MNSHWKIHDGRERCRVQTCAAHQRSVNVLLRHQAAHVVWFHASAIEDAAGIGDIGSKCFGDLSADEGVGGGGHFGSGHFAGANGPDTARTR